MATTKDFVTSLQDQYVEGVRRSQQAVVEALNLWTESIGRVAPDL